MLIRIFFTIALPILLCGAALFEGLSVGYSLLNAPNDLAIFGGAALIIATVIFVLLIITTTFSHFIEKGL